MISDDMDVEKVIDTTNTDIPKPFEYNNNIISDAEDEYVDLFRKQIEILKVDFKLINLYKLRSISLIIINKKIFLL